jgi:Ca-activated chloride channel homolog
VSWGNLPALYLLLPALAVAVGLYLFSAMRRKKLSTALAEAGLYEKIAGEVNGQRRAIKTVLLIVSLLLLILAAARLRTGLASELARKQGIDLVVALDVSKSMLAEDIKPTRFDRARAELLDLLGRLQGDRVGIVIFSGSAFVQCPLTTDYTAARTFLKAARVGAVPTGGTAIAAAIDTSTDLLQRSANNSRVIMLLTDGENTEGDPMQSAARATDLGINIYAIGIGTEKGEPLPMIDEQGEVSGYQQTSDGKVVLSRLDEKTLLELVRSSGGDYRRADRASIGVASLWQDIEKLQRGLIETRIFTRYKENYIYFLFPALLLLFFEAMFSERRRRR